MGPERLPKSLLSWIPESGKRRRGEMPHQMEDTIRGDVDYAGVEQDAEVERVIGHSDGSCSHYWYPDTKLPG